MTAVHGSRSPDAIAIREVRGGRTRRTITHAALGARVASLTAGLAAEGFAAGDRVLFSVRPGIDAIALVLAVRRLGGVLLPQDPGTSDALFAARVRLLAPRWVMAESLLMVPPAGVVARLLALGGLRLAPLGEVPGARRVRVGPWLPGLPDATTLDALARRGRAVASAATPALLDVLSLGTAGSEAATPGDAGPDADAEAFIVCTSGTTDAPRAVVHTEGSLRAILSAVARELALTPRDVVCTRELHLVLPALVAGAEVIIPRELAFAPGAWCRTVATCGVTHAFLSTRDCLLVVEHLEAQGARLSDTLRSLMIGAAPVRTPFLARLAPRLPAGCDAWCVYGATELLPIARVTLRDKVAWTGEGDLVGAPLPGVHVRVDERGELHVRGDALCRGYAGAPPMTEHATGDLARLDGDQLVLLGRRKDMIIRGDHNVYPELYEPLVERIPGVRRAALLGDFDERRADERIVLVVEPMPGVRSEALRKVVHDGVRRGPHRLDRAALPDEIVVHSIPDGGRSRKPDKSALRRALGLRTPGRVAESSGIERIGAGSPDDRSAGGATAQ